PAPEIVNGTLLDPAEDVEPDVHLIRSAKRRSGNRSFITVRNHQFKNVSIRAELISERVERLVVDHVRRQRPAADTWNKFSDNRHVLPDLDRRTQPDRHHVVLERRERRPAQIEDESRVYVQSDPVKQISGENEFNRRNVLSVMALAGEVAASLDRSPGHD